MDWNELSPLLSVSKCVWVSGTDPAIIRLQGGLKSQQSADPHKGIFNFLKHLTHTHMTSLFLVPCGLHSLAVLEVSRMQAALYRLPPAGFNAPRHHAPHAVAVRRPPSIPQSTPRGPFLAPGHRPTEGATRKRAGEMEGTREKVGKRQTLGEKKWLQVWINHNHLSRESAACVTSQRTTWLHTNTSHPGIHQVQILL